MARTWREQYDRMNRWLARLAEGESVDERRVDDFYAFFTCCFHLKDWLKADAGVDPKLKLDVETLFDKDTGVRWLQVCADVTNGLKHLKANRTTRVDPDGRVEKTTFAFDTAGFSPEAFLTRDMIIVEASGTPWVAVELAKKCVAAWDAFLSGHGLLT